MLTEEELRSRLHELEEQRQKLIEAANREMAILNGRIAELERILTPPVNA